VNSSPDPSAKARALEGIDATADPAPAGVETVYFDTATLALAARQITLQYRTGGVDAGWQLSFRAGRGQPPDVVVPAGRPGKVPGEVLRQVLVYTRGADIIPVARTLGGAAAAERTAGIRKPSRKGPAVDVAIAYLDLQITEILAQDPGVRQANPDAVYRLRSATRSARSALATYRKLFRKPAVRHLQDELKWLAGILGQARDAEVTRNRLRVHLLALLPELHEETVPARVEDQLAAALEARYRAVVKTLETSRYYRLLDALEEFRNHPPVTPRAARPAGRETAILVNRVATRLDRAHRAAAQLKRGPAREDALHRVRKDAKNLRYAAESVAGLHGKRAAAMVSSAQALQKILGVHRDAVMARAFLGALAADPSLPDATAAAYRRIRRVEKSIVRATEKEYFTAWQKTAGVRLRR
jgi:CHAD domain-containing protein